MFIQMSTPVPLYEAWEDKGNLSSFSMMDLNSFDRDDIPSESSPS